MAKDLVDFDWWVSDSGYQWVEGREALWGPLRSWYSPETEQWFLTTGRLDCPRDVGATRVRPLEKHSGLFRTFAELEPTEEAIIDFASHYGTLGEGVAVPVALLSDDPIAKTDQYQSGSQLLGEALASWQAEILSMRQLVRLWEMTEGKRHHEIRRYVHWAGNDSVWYDSEPLDDKAARKILPATPAVLDATGGTDPFLYAYASEGLPIIGGEDAQAEQARSFVRLAEEPLLRTRAVIASRAINADMLPGFVPGEVLAAARFYLQRAVSWQIQGLIDIKLRWEAGDKRGKLRLIPKSLLGALWLQFAEAIHGDAEFRQCGSCNTWFELSPKASRTNRLYCSDPCKMKAYRKRKKGSRRGIRNLSQRRMGK